MQRSDGTRGEPIVLIVGAGPAGASLAVALGRAGFSVRLIEASPRFDRQFRGEALMPSGLEALAQLDLGTLPADIPRRPLGSWSFYLEGSILFQASEPMGSPWPCTLIEQASLLRWLVSQAERLPEVGVVTGRSVVGLIHEGARVAGVTLSDGSSLRCDLVIGCDGRRSLLRRRSGLPFTPAAAPIDVLWFRLRRPWSNPMAEWLGNQFLTCLGADAGYALFTTAAGEVQLGWVLDRSGRTAEDPGPPDPVSRWQDRWASCSPQDLAPGFRELPEAAIEGPIHLPVEVGIAQRWSLPGLLLLGDAAHPMSPLRAQGINMALRDAATAAGILGSLRRAAGSDGLSPSDLDACLARIEAERIGEVRTIQALQAREAGRASLLRKNGWLRRLLLLTTPWSSPLLARHWIHGQLTLRKGSTGLGEQRRQKSLP